MSRLICLTPIRSSSSRRPLAPDVFCGHDQQGVVAGDRPEHAVEPGPVDGPGHDVGRPRAGPDDEDVAGRPSDSTNSSMMRTVSRSSPVGVAGILGDVVVQAAVVRFGP